MDNKYKTVSEIFEDYQFEFSFLNIKLDDAIIINIFNSNLDDGIMVNIFNGEYELSDNTNEQDILLCLAIKSIRLTNDDFLFYSTKCIEHIEKNNYNTIEHNITRIYAILFMYYETKDNELAKKYLKIGEKLLCPLCIGFMAKENKVTEPEKYIQITEKLAMNNVLIFALDLFIFYFQCQEINKAKQLLKKLNKNTMLKTIRGVRELYRIQQNHQFLDINKITKKFDEEFYYFETSLYYYEQNDIKNFTKYSLKTICCYKNKMAIITLFKYYVLNCTKKQLSNIFMKVLQYCGYEIILECYDDEQYNTTITQLYIILDNIIVNKINVLYYHYKLCLNKVLQYPHVQFLIKKNELDDKNLIKSE